MRNNKEIPWTLLISKFKGQLSADEELKLSERLCVSDNLEVFNELKNLWKLVEERAGQYEPDVPYYEKLLMQKIHQKQNKAQFLVFFSRYYKYAAVLVAVILTNLFTFMYLENRSENKLLLMPRHYENVSGKSKIMLADSTVVWMHENTNLNYLARNSSHQRSVELFGEAFFEVTPGDLPFIVNLGDFAVKVHGTAFNIRNYGNTSTTEVTLVEGSVELLFPNKSCFLLPGQKGIYNKRSKTINVTDADVEIEKSWAQEQFTFNQWSLDKICRHLSRWYNVEIVIDPEVAASEYASTFTVRSEPLEEIMRLLTRIHPICYSFSEKNILTIKNKY